MKAGLPSLRESLLFRSWALTTPIAPYRGHPHQQGVPHELFNDAWVRYPFSDDYFWRASDEGIWDEEGVPCWTDPSVEDVEVD